MLKAINCFLATTFRNNMEYVSHLWFRVTKQSQTEQGSQASSAGCTQLACSYHKKFCKTLAIKQNIIFGESHI